MDVGCGTRLFTDIISSSTAQYVGVDLSEAMLHEAKLKARRTCEERKRSFLRADATHLPFKDASFGGILSVGMVLAHLDSYERGLTEISRVLCPKGRFLIEADNKWSVDFLHYLADALTAGKVLRYGFADMRKIVHYIQNDEYEWDAAADGLPTGRKILLHKISARRLTRLLKELSMKSDVIYGIHFATLFMPRGMALGSSAYLRFVTLLDRRLASKIPFSFLGGSLIVLGKKDGGPSGTQSATGATSTFSQLCGFCFFTAFLTVWISSVYANRS